MTPLFAQRGRADRVFERIYRRHAGDVYRYAFAVLHNRADAEDVTQTTFMNAYRALERGERPERPHNWLIAIAHNVCRQRFRQSQRRPSEVEWHDDVADRLVVEDDKPTGDDIRRALSYLPFNQRAAIVMRELEGRSYAEIADVLELSVGAVETLIFRARRALREQLEGALTCTQAEVAISKQLDGRLSRSGKSALRAHLRECDVCATFARRQRAQRSALKALGSIPLPASIASILGGGGGGTVTAVAAKAAAVVAATALAGGVGYESVHRVVHGRSRPVPHHPVRLVRAPAPAAVPHRVLAQPVLQRAGVPRHEGPDKKAGHDGGHGSRPGGHEGGHGRGSHLPAASGDPGRHGGGHGLHRGSEHRHGGGDEPGASFSE